MTEMIESASAEMIELDEHDDQVCPFCQSKDFKPEVKNNVFEHDKDEDISEKIGFVGDIDGVQHKNCAATLGRNIGGESSLPPLRKVTQETWPVDLDVAYAAHHLIPGYGSLTESELYKCHKFLRYEGQKEGNIGYNINCKENGVWLPGNYAYSQKKDPLTGKPASEWGSKGSLLEVATGVKAEEYVPQVISQTGRQFHDAHGKYNDFVTNQLDKIHDKLQASEDEVWCMAAQKRSENEDAVKQPLYSLVGRLGHLSGRLEKKLVFPTTNWNVNVFTSTFAHTWMKDFNKKVSSR